ncbi:MAG: VapC toxin family PIN domain ribonuclease [Ponticaulis sp.]|nr:VapC toxin family PIN domain ribonuclease [Ponticaulis sp.]
MSGLLLDTCAVIWLSEGKSASAATTERLEAAFDGGEPVLVSLITAWEIGMLYRKGRVSLTLDPEDWLDLFMKSAHADWAQMTPRILVRSSNLPGLVHSDPADRIIISTARQAQLTILTGDRTILDYGESGYVSVLPY